MEMKMKLFGIFFMALALALPLAHADSSLPVDTMAFHSGWNMVSVPVDTKITMVSVADTCGTAAYAWRMDQSGYVKAEILEPGYGYWIKGTRDCTYRVTGVSRTSTLSSLFPGWNLVGAYGHTVSISDVKNNCAITAGPWHYDPSIKNYEYSSTLSPSQAYWIKVSSSCSLLESDTPPVPPDNNQTLTSYPSIGSQGSSVVVTEFADFQCPYCGIAHGNGARGSQYDAIRGTEAKVIENYAKTGKVLFVYHMMAFLGQESTDAGNAALCVREVGGDSGFFAMEDKMFDSQNGENKGAFSKVNLKAFASAIGYGSTQVASCIDSGKYDSQVSQSTAAASSMDVSGTPTFMVNGVKVSSADYATVKAAIDSALGSPSTTNQPPVISGGSSQTSLKVGETGAWTIYASDPEGGQLTYSVLWGDGEDVKVTQKVPQGSPNSQTQIFTHSYASAGTYTVKITVTDDQGASAQSSSAVVVSATQVAEQHIIIPTSGNYEVNVAWYDTSGYSVIAVETPNYVSLGTFSGANNWTNSVTSLGYLPAGTEVVLSIQTNWYARWYDKAYSTNPYYFSISQSGDTFAIEADDGLKYDGGFNDAKIYIRPVSAVANKPPVISGGTSPASLKVGETGTWTIYASDPEGKQLTYSVLWGDEASASEAQTINAKAVASGQTSTFTHSYARAGTYNVQFTVYDDQGASAQSISAVAVGAAQVILCSDSDNGFDYYTKGVAKGEYGQRGSTPVILGTEPELTRAKASPYSYSVYYDHCANSMQLNEGYCDSATGLLMSNGYSCQYGCSDGACEQAPKQNKPPVISGGSSPSQLKVGETGTWSIHASDPEGKQLTYSVAWGDEASAGTAQPSAKAVASGQTSTFTHSYASAGTYTVKFTVTDNQGASAQSSSTVAVASTDTVAPSVSASVSPYNMATSGNVYTITATASDASGISGITIYMAQGSPNGHGDYFTKSCTSSPCTYTTGNNDGQYVYYATATDASSQRNTASTEVAAFTLPFGNAIAQANMTVRSKVY